MIRIFRDQHMRHIRRTCESSVYGAVRRSFLYDAGVSAGVTHFGRTVRITRSEQVRIRAPGDVFTEMAKRAAAVRAGLCFYTIVSTSRGNSAGSERRAGFFATFSFTAMVASCAGSASAAAWLASRSSSRSSSCSMPAFIFSDGWPKCMRLSLRTSRSAFLDLGVAWRALSVLEAGAIRHRAQSMSGSWFLRLASLLTASIPQLCHELTRAAATKMANIFAKNCFIPPCSEPPFVSGLRQSMPSSSMESCARPRETWPPWSACGQTKRPRSRRL